jgi:superfamily II DNA/RNA helicase
VRDCQALILAPTRELATQIVKVVMAIGDYLGVSTMVRRGPQRAPTQRLPLRGREAGGSRV